MITHRLKVKNLSSYYGVQIYVLSESHFKNITQESMWYYFEYCTSIEFIKLLQCAKIVKAHLVMK